MAELYALERTCATTWDVSLGTLLAQQERVCAASHALYFRLLTFKRLSGSCQQILPILAAARMTQIRRGSIFSKTQGLFPSYHGHGTMAIHTAATYPPATRAVYMGARHIGTSLEETAR
jgi:hypothetical protein